MIATDTIAPVSGHYRHPDFGEVVVRTRANARTMKAFWRDSSLIVNIPSCCSEPVLRRFLTDARDRLMQAKVTRFFINKVIDAGEVDMSVVAGEASQVESIRIYPVRRDPLRGKAVNFIISVKPSLVAAIGDTFVQKAINRAVKNCALAAARRFLIPYAQSVAARIGRRPGMWAVKDSVRALGRCNSNGVIQLSPRLMFLPEDLRRYVICHELAHLSEMNHSEAFHALCDKYTEGRERELDKRLKAFRFPID